MNVTELWQWAIVLVIILAAVGWVVARRFGKSGEIDCKRSDSNCDDCPLKKNCEKS